MNLLDRIDRRVIYLFVAIALAIPLKLKWTLPPAEMTSASDLYKTVSTLENTPGKIALIAFDWGPSTRAENGPQTAVIIEHLMRRRIPFAGISITPYAAPFLDSLPREIAKQLAGEIPGQTWSYGKDWVNLGYQPGASIMVQSLAKTKDLHEVLSADAYGTPLRDIPCMKEVRSIKDISLLAELTGLVGAFNVWIQFFQSSDYRPTIVHGCTSITIPEAYIYYVSGQISGLHEGVAGAAWYEHLLSSEFPKRKSGSALKVNTSLATAHIVVLFFILLGNAGLILSRLEIR